MDLEVQEDKRLFKLIQILSISIGVSYIVFLIMLIFTTLYSIYKRYNFNYKKEYNLFIYAIIIALIKQNYLGILVGIGLFSFYYISYIKKYIYVDKIIQYSSYMAIFEIIYSLVTKTRAGYISMYNPNYYGSFLAILIVSYFFKKYDKKYLMIYLIALFFTGSRFAIVSLLIALSLFMFYVNKYLAIIIITTISLYLYFVFLNIVPFVRADTIQEYLVARLWIYKLAIIHLKENYIFGSGFYFFRDFTNKIYPHTHNIFLEIINSVGLLGSVYLIKLSLNLKLNKKRFILLALVLIHGIADYTIFWPQTALLFLIYFN